VERSTVPAILSWKCFSTERSVVEGPAVLSQRFELLRISSRDLARTLFCSDSLGKRHAYAVAGTKPLVHMTHCASSLSGHKVLLLVLGKKLAAPG
jgi:hypothetical protein